jgi:hypothetical protein
MIHDISLGEERERDIKFIDLFVSKAQGSYVEKGRKEKHVGSPLAPCSLTLTLTL